MATVHDVAAYILDNLGSMTAVKLQKLVYYSQVWSLVWDEEPLFSERIEAWANGPVVPQLYREHQGKFKVGRRDISGRPSHLAREQKETIEAVIKHYGNRSSQWLSDLTHVESPWKDARKDLPPGARGNNLITHSAMSEYYGSL